MSRYKEAAIARGKARSAAVAMKVRKAMKTIVAEMKANGGIYPQNGGAVSKNEVARRAQISLSTLSSPIQKNLGKRVSRWVEILRAKETVGRKRVRKTHQQRAEDWKAIHDRLQQRHYKTELELQQMEAERDDALAKYEKAMAEVDRLLREKAELVKQQRAGSASNVKTFQRGKV